MPRPNGAPKFAGFSTPHYTPVPDDLFDRLLSDLSGAELKALLYIMRRTMGFKKNSDDISLSQICGGITTRAGQVLDRGTGLSRSTAIGAIRSLEEWGLIYGVRNASEAHGHEATTYHLHLVADPGTIIVPGGWAGERSSPGSIVAPALVRKSDPQETVEQETGKQETDPIDQIDRSPPCNDEAGREALRLTIADFSRELGDAAHERANLTRATNLWRATRVPTAEFIQLLYDARALTRHYQGKQPPGRRIEAKGAYFFAILTQMLTARGLIRPTRDPPAAPPPHAAHAGLVAMSKGESP